MTVLFLELVSTQVTKSSMFLVTSNAGSVVGVGPTRICPCSIVLTACMSPCASVGGGVRVQMEAEPTSLTVSAIFNRQTTTAKRRRQKAETVTLFSMSDGLEPVSRGNGQEWSVGVRRMIGI